jgi:nitrogen fixation protein FixH
MPDSDPQEQTSVSPLHKIMWPGLLIALFGGHLLLMFVMAYLATSDGSFAIEPDYYQKALHWDETAAQLRENDRLGWTAEIELGEDVSVLGHRTVRCVVTGKQGEPIEDAIVDLIAFHHAHGSDRTPVTLEPVGAGRYETTLRLPYEGLWEFRLVVHRGSDTVTRTHVKRVRMDRRYLSNDRMAFPGRHRIRRRRPGKAVVRMELGGVGK